MTEPPDDEHPIIDNKVRILKATVKAAARLTPHMVEITLAGPDLRQCPDIGPDAFLYLFVPREQGGSPGVEYDFSWDTWRTQPEDQRAVGRYYTVRRLRAE